MSTTWASYAGRRDVVAELNDYYRTLGVSEETSSTWAIPRRRFGRVAGGGITRRRKAGKPRSARISILQRQENRSDDSERFSCPYCPRKELFVGPENPACRQTRDSSPVTTSLPQSRPWGSPSVSAYSCYYRGNA